MKSQQTNLKSLLHLKQAFFIPMIIATFKYQKTPVAKNWCKGLFRLDVVDTIRFRSN
ncbi:hypothetical protein HMPREF1150_0962 [Streptococcus sp. AS14]|nr:hypothetical protein HMPREF1150_0962 [Streptococcus sp. AS14]